MDRARHGGQVTGRPITSLGGQMKDRELIPDAFRTTVKRLPGGTLVLTQFGDAGDQMLLIPDRYVKAVCEGLYHASLERDSE